MLRLNYLDVHCLQRYEFLLVGVICIILRFDWLVNIVLINLLKQ